MWGEGGEAGDLIQAANFKTKITKFLYWRSVTIPSLVFLIQIRLNSISGGGGRFKGINQSQIFYNKNGYTHAMFLECSKCEGLESTLQSPQNLL